MAKWQKKKCNRRFSVCFSSPSPENMRENICVRCSRMFTLWQNQLVRKDYGGWEGSWGAVSTRTRSEALCLNTVFLTYMVMDGKRESENEGDCWAWSAKSTEVKYWESLVRFPVFWLQTLGSFKHLYCSLASAVKGKGPGFMGDVCLLAVSCRCDFL